MIRDGTAVGPRHHSRLLALILAKVVAVSANKRAMTAATSGKRRGSHTAASSGQAILIMAGMSGGWISSTVIVSAGVIWPEARVVMGDDVLTAGLRPV